MVQNKSLINNLKFLWIFFLFEIIDILLYMNNGIQQNSNLSSFYSVPLLQTKITGIVKKVWKVRQIDEKKADDDEGIWLPSEFSISGKFSSSASRVYNKGQLIECRIMSELEKEQMAQKFSVFARFMEKIRICRTHSVMCG